MAQYSNKTESTDGSKLEMHLSILFPFIKADLIKIGAEDLTLRSWKITENAMYEQEIILPDKRKDRDEQFTFV